MTTVIYNNSSPYTGNRPYADVVLVPSHPGAPTYKCLVDTGADYLQLPASAAGAVGIALSSAQNNPVTTAAGTANLLLVQGVNVSIEGHSVTVDVLFDPTNITMNIAVSMIAHMEPFRDRHNQAT